MISADDIDAFKEDFEVCQEFVRRFEKGIPEDRWTDGVKGNVRLARAVRRMLRLHHETAGMMAAMYLDLQQYQKEKLDSMEPFKDPMRE